MSPSNTAWKQPRSTTQACPHIRDLPGKCSTIKLVRETGERVETPSGGVPRRNWKSAALCPRGRPNGNREGVSEPARTCSSRGCRVARPGPQAAWRPRIPRAVSSWRRGTQLSPSEVLGATRQPAFTGSLLVRVRSGIIHSRQVLVSFEAGTDRHAAAGPCRGIVWNTPPARVAPRTDPRGTMPGGRSQTRRPSRGRAGSDT